MHATPAGGPLSDAARMLRCSNCSPHLRRQHPEPNRLQPLLQQRPLPGQHRPQPAVEALLVVQPMRHRALQGRAGGAGSRARGNECMQLGALCAWASSPPSASPSRPVRSKRPHPCRRRSQAPPTCRLLGTVKVMNWCACATALTISAGPVTQPTCRRSMAGQHGAGAPLECVFGPHPLGGCPASTTYGGSANQTPATSQQ